MTEDSKKILYFSISAVVLVLVLILGVYFAKKNKTTKEEMSKSDSTLPATEDKTSGSVNITKKVQSLNYREALEKYGSSRIQLNDKCQAVPNNMTFKNGTELMIDNRSGFNRTIKLGSIYSLKAYSFKIIKLSSDNLPNYWLLDCDNSQNVATILIQK